MKDMEDTLETPVHSIFLSSSQHGLLFSLSLSFILLFLLFTLLLWVLLVPARQLLANPPVAKHPAADSNLRDFYQQPTTEELSERVDKGSKSNE